MISAGNNRIIKVSLRKNFPTRARGSLLYLVFFLRSLVQAATRRFILDSACSMFDRCQKWAIREAHFFAARVLFPDAEPQLALTSRALEQEQQGLQEEHMADLDDDSSSTSSSDSSSSSSSSSGSDDEADEVASVPVTVDESAPVTEKKDAKASKLTASEAQVLEEEISAWATKQDGTATTPQTPLSLSRENLPAPTNSSVPSWQLQDSDWRCLVSGKSLSNGCNPGERSSLLACGATVFLATWLLSDSMDESLVRCALQKLLVAFGPLLWSLTDEQVAGAQWKKLPEEIFQSPTTDELWTQYVSFRQVAQRVAKTKKVQDMGKSWEDWDKHLHSLMLCLMYEVAKPFWHILRLYHRFVVWTFDAEAACERAASTLRYLEKKAAVGRSPGTASMMDSLLLRYYNCDGHPSSWSFMLSVLQQHFRRKKNKKLHFFVSSRTRHSRTSRFGPSTALHKRREKIQAEPETALWLSSRVKWHLAKSIPRHVIRDLQKDDDHEPSVFVQEMWDIVLPVLKQAGIVPPED